MWFASTKSGIRKKKHQAHYKPSNLLFRFFSFLLGCSLGGPCLELHVLSLERLLPDAVECVLNDLVSGLLGSS